MKIKTALIAFAAGLLFSAAAFAQVPASAPAGSTGLCKDGTYWSGPTKKGACRGHKGVQDWYAAATAPAATTTTAPAAPTSPMVAAPAAPAKPMTSAPVTSSAMAAGGSAGQVWVNTPTKVYHCPGTKWYGKTKVGTYMSEQDAIAAGDRADHGKACH